jgi:pyruvate dehydrogenase E1 component beta subunit
MVVMYVGKVVEIGRTEDLYDHPQHPYTEALLKSVPKMIADKTVRKETLEGEVPDEEYVVPIGRADVKREGTDLTIVTHSYMTHLSLQAAAILEKEGVSVEVVDLRSVKPMDTATITESVKKTIRLLCVQETWLTCGVAAEVAAVVAEQAFDYLDAPIRRLGSRDCPAPFAPELEQFVLPSVDKIVAAVRGMM